MKFHIINYNLGIKLIFLQPCLLDKFLKQNYMLKILTGKSNHGYTNNLF